MHTIDLTYVGRGIHEELIAYVADQEGYFEDEGVHVAVRDGIRWETERLRGSATIGLGRALLSRLTNGIQWTVLAVNTHRPLFWFLGRGEVKSMDDDAVTAVVPFFQRGHASFPPQNRMCGGQRRDRNVTPMSSPVFPLKRERGVAAYAVTPLCFTASVKLGI
jgi:hypothetical protein